MISLKVNNKYSYYYYKQYFLLDYYRDSIIAQLNTVYFNETCTDSQCDIAFRYSVMPITTKPFVITFKLSTLGSLFTKTLTITAQTNYSIQMV